MNNENGLLNMESTTTSTESTTTSTEPTTPTEPTKPTEPTDNKNSKSFAEDWKSYIPEELKNRSEWNNIKDPSDLFKNYINAQQTISKSVRIPEEGSSPEDIASFYAKLGKPKSKEDYKVQYTPSKKEYIYNADSFDINSFRDIADKANLTADQFQALASAYIDVNNEMYLNFNKNLETRAAQELKEAEHKLKLDWGGQYTQNINMISEKIQQIYPKATLEKMKKAGLFRDADFLSSHLKLTKMMTGDTVFIEGNVVENVPQTLQTLTEQRDKLMSEDYLKNREQVLSLNQKIVKLKQSQQSGAARFNG